MLGGSELAMRTLFLLLTLLFTFYPEPAGTVKVEVFNKVTI